MRIDELLSQPEGKHLDYKRALSTRSALKGALEDLVAFANSAGGVLVIGVNDDRAVVGVEEPEIEEERLANAIADQLTPRMVYDIRRSSHRGKTVLLVEVPRQLGPVHFKTAGETVGTYVRVSSTSRRADPGQIDDLRRAVGARSWDEEPCPNAAIDDLDTALAQRVFDERTAVGFESTRLRSCHLVVDSGGGLVPSNGGVVLFAKDRRKHFLDDARFRCITYPGLTKAGDAIDPVDFEDMTVLEALPYVVEYIRRHTGSFREIKGMDRIERPGFSDAIVREVLHNAVAHANYQVKGVRLAVSIYSDRVEIQNPGTWPPGITLDDLKNGVSKVRNRAIAKTMRVLRYVEEDGTGYARIRTAMGEGYPEPEWTEHGGPVMRVTLRPHPKSLTPSLHQVEHDGAEGAPARGEPRRGTRERRARILAFIAAHGPVRVPAIVEAVGMSAPTIERDVAALRRDDEIHFEGAPAKGGYVTRPRHR